MIFLNPHPSAVKNAPARLSSRNGSAVLVSKAPAVESGDHPNEISSNDSSEEKVVHHPEFFFDNTLIAIRIENTLFNVHKYQLAKSEFFSEMFKLPKSDDGEPEDGSSPENPIVIRGAAASDFAALLRVLYASHFSSHQPTPEASLIIPAFRLANLLSFSELRAYLLPLAEKSLNDVDKIVFAREFDITEWLVPAFTRLCKRESVLSTEEARKLDVDSVLLLWRLREQHRSRGTTAAVNSLYCHGCAGMTASGGSSFSYNCKHCGTYRTGFCVRYDGPGELGTKDSFDDTALEAEVTQWVRDVYTAKE